MKVVTPSWLNDLAGAWVFYSILPGWPWPKPTFNRIARFAPFIGLFIGAIQSGLWIALTFFGWPEISSALITIAFSAWVTGGLHIDGLMDTADGLAAGKARCLEAMEDSRVGASGVIALLLIIMLQIASLTKLNTRAPFAFPIAAFWGRCSALWAINHFTYLKEKGSASFHHYFRRGWIDIFPALTALITALMIFTLLNNSWEIQFPIFHGILVGVIPTFLVPHFLGNKLNGHSGDSYGASVVIVETIILLTLACL